MRLISQKNVDEGRTVDVNYDNVTLVLSEDCYCKNWELEAWDYNSNLWSMGKYDSKKKAEIVMKNIRTYFCEGSSHFIFPENDDKIKEEMFL